MPLCLLCLFGSVCLFSGRLLDPAMNRELGKMCSFVQYTEGSHRTPRPYEGRKSFIPPSLTPHLTAPIMSGPNPITARNTVSHTMLLNDIQNPNSGLASSGVLTPHVLVALSRAGGGATPTPSCASPPSQLAPLKHAPAGDRTLRSIDELWRARLALSGAAKHVEDHQDALEVRGPTPWEPLQTPSPAEDGKKKEITPRRVIQVRNQYFSQGRVHPAEIHVVELPAAYDDTHPASRNRLLSPRERRAVQDFAVVENQAKTLVCQAFRERSKMEEVLKLQYPQGAMTCSEVPHFDAVGTVRSIQKANRKLRGRGAYNYVTDPYNTPSAYTAASGARMHVAEGGEFPQLTEFRETNERTVAKHQGGQQLFAVLRHQEGLEPIKLGRKSNGPDEHTIDLAGSAKEALPYRFSKRMFYAHPAEYKDGSYHVESPHTKWARLALRQTQEEFYKKEDFVRHHQKAPALSFIEGLRSSS
jgi:hypothetical protein